ncbi:hypothetical protein Fcan01_23871 [Folsomia candida]|uniref:Uncharacterized protein n=1 Tax=Folsomia candida TaxID=158441 RepID=A0A226D8C6_FOLCA|nr:hypothetical protein Fcan01_23871 [Folsomia candida]
MIMTDPLIHSRPLKFPFSYWDNYAIWCGNVNQDLSLSTCGRGIIVANYTAGSIIDVIGNFQPAHYGSFQVELCHQEEETDFCFQLLNIVEGSEDIRMTTEFVSRKIIHRKSMSYRRFCCQLASGYNICFNPNPAQVLTEEEEETAVRAIPITFRKWLEFGVARQAGQLKQDVTEHDQTQLSHFKRCAKMDVAQKAILAKYSEFKIQENHTNPALNYLEVNYLRSQHPGPLIHPNVAAINESLQHTTSKANLNLSRF